MKQTGLLKPLVTEKAARLQSAHNVYAFVIDVGMSKGAVELAFRKMYNVKLAAIRIVRMDGKKVRFGKTSGQEKSFKKAFVTLEKGATIAVVDPTKKVEVSAEVKTEKKKAKKEKKANA